MARAGTTLVNPVTGHRYHVLQASADTGGALLDMEATFPPGAPRPPAHLHPRQEEHFTLLDGSLHVEVAGAHRVLHAGDTLVVPAGVPHAMWNPDAAPARVRWRTCPALRTEQFFEALVSLAAQGRVSPRGTPGLLDLALLAGTFRHEMRLVRPSPAVQRVLFGALALLARTLGRRLGPPSA